MTFDHIANFMNTKQKVIMVNANVASRLAAEEGGMLQGIVNTENQVKVTVQLGDSLYSTIQSAVFLFRQNGVERSAEVKRGASLYCKGSKRKGQKLK